MAKYKRTDLPKYQQLTAQNAICVRMPFWKSESREGKTSYPSAKQVLRILEPSNKQVNITQIMDTMVKIRLEALKNSPYYNQPLTVKMINKYTKLEKSKAFIEYSHPMFAEDFRITDQALMGAIRRQRSQELESGFQQKVKMLKASYDDIKDASIKDRLEDTGLYQNKWLGDTAPKQNAYRVLQFNVLSHGWSHYSNGFASNYRDGAPNDIDADEEDETYWLHKEKYRDLLMGHCCEDIFTNNDGKPMAIDAPPRFKRVLGVILKENPDIITMQEVDHYHDFWRPYLNVFGYEGDFKEKTKAKRWGSIQYNGGLKDGCAIFWNSEKLEQIGFTKKLILKDNTGKDSSQVALYVMLRDRRTNKRFAVVTSHMKAGGLRPINLDKKDPYCRDCLNKGYPCSCNWGRLIAMKADNHVTQEEYDTALRCLEEEQKNCDKCKEGLIRKRVSVKKTSKPCPKCNEKNIADDFKDRNETKVEVNNGESWVKATIKSFAEDRKSCTVRLDGAGPDEDRLIDLPDNNKNEIRVRDAWTIDYKSHQAKFMREEIEKLNVPAIYACDFNSNPATAAYKTLIKKAENEPPQLLRAYEEFSGEGFKKPDYNLIVDKREPGCKYSSAKWRKGGEQKDKLCKTVQTIDFIFYTTGTQDKQKHWKCHAVLDLPTLEHLKERSPLLLNDWKYPSDHFCIGADLELVFENDKPAAVLELQDAGVKVVRDDYGHTF